MKKKTISQILVRLLIDYDKCKNEHGEMHNFRVFVNSCIEKAESEIKALIDVTELEHEIQRALVLYVDANLLIEDFHGVAEHLKQWLDSNY